MYNTQDNNSNIPEEIINAIYTQAEREYPNNGVSEVSRAFARKAYIEGSKWMWLNSHEFTRFHTRNTSVFHSFPSLNTTK